MFKKSLLALAVAGLAFSSAEAAQVISNDDSSLSVGGRVKTDYKSVSATRNKDKSALDGSARLNIDGSTKIYGDIKAVAFAEWDVAATTSTNKTFDAREVYVGFDSEKYGTLTFGQVHTALYKVVEKTDVFTEWGSTANTYWDLGGRQEGQIKYVGGFNGLEYAVSYQSAALDKIDNGVAVTLGYTLDLNAPLFFGVGYDMYNYSDDNSDGNDRQQSIAASASYGVFNEGFAAAALYQHTKFDNKVSSQDKNKNSWEVVVGYGLDNGLYGLLGYENAKYTGADDYAVSHINAEVGYFFTDNFQVYAETSLGVGNVENARTEGKSESEYDLLSVGLIYNF